MNICAWCNNPSREPSGHVCCEWLHRATNAESEVTRLKAELAEARKMPRDVGRALHELVYRCDDGACSLSNPCAVCHQYVSDVEEYYAAPSGKGEA